MKRTSFYLTTVLCISLATHRGAGESGAGRLIRGSNSLRNGVIQNKAEHQAYAEARKQTNPVKRAVMLEAFIAHFPESDLTGDALEEALALYGKFDRQRLQEAAAESHPAIDATNFPSRALNVFSERAQVENVGPDSPQRAIACSHALEDIADLAKWQKPNNFSMVKFNQLRSKVGSIFYGMAGFCHLLAKQFAEARSYYLKSVEFDPESIPNLAELAEADLEMTPIDVRGFWYAARSMMLSRAKLGGWYDRS
jgi:tetratricopeptide (TPR) repeat protein